MEEKVFFAPGDIVTIKQDIHNKPLMVVKSVDKSIIRKKGPDEEGSKSMLFGITCFWFTDNMSLEESRFNTKDLVHAT